MELQMTSVALNSEDQKVVAWLRRHLRVGRKNPTYTSIVRLALRALKDKLELEGAS
jgi:hypothetical protein